MKKLIILLIGVLFSISCVAQQSVALNDAVSVKLPSKTEKITKEEALIHASKKFNNDKLVLNNISSNSSSYTYKIDDILISLFPHEKTINVKDGYLLSAKKGADEMNYGDTTYRGTLRMVNGNSVLVIRNIINDIGYYNFRCYNSTKTRAIAGQLQFRRQDEKEATSILDDLLNSIQFKD